MRASSENRRWWDGANETPPDALCIRCANGAPYERDSSKFGPAIRQDSTGETGAYMTRLLREWATDWMKPRRRCAIASGTVDAGQSMRRDGTANALPITLA